MRHLTVLLLCVLLAGCSDPAPEWAAEETIELPLRLVRGMVDQLKATNHALEVEVKELRAILARLEADNCVSPTGTPEWVTQEDER